MFDEEGPEPIPLEDLGIGYRGAIPLGRAGTIDDIAKAVDQRLPVPMKRHCLVQFKNHTAGHHLVLNNFLTYNFKLPINDPPKDVGMSMETTALFPKAELKTAAVFEYHLTDGTNVVDDKALLISLGVRHGGGIPDDERESWFYMQLSQAKPGIDVHKTGFLDDQRRNGVQSQKLIKEGFRVEATMTDSSQPNIVVEIYDN